jgi:hypothetical protein
MSDCNNCGGVVQCVDSDGGIEEGRFVEKYECTGCDAWGTIKGEASDPPQTWQEEGPIFNKQDND